MLLTRDRAAGDGLLLELLLAGLLFSVTAWTAARMQTVTVTRYWDGDEYSLAFSAATIGWIHIRATRTHAF